MKRIFRIICVLFFVMLIDLPVSVRADIAPPGHPPGSNPEPGAEFTEVRMMAETVLIEVQASTPQNSLGQAKVKADFTMRNQGSTSESMSVRFPLASNNGFGEIPEIENLSVEVNGSLVVTRRILQEDPMWRGDAVPWAEFDVTFPPNQDVNILVTYLLEGTGEYPYAAFYYIFRTGAGWKDSIGSADLIVRLPYQASAQNVIFDEHTGWSFTTPGGVIGGQEIRWHFENFEPDQSNDFEISLVMPSAWQRVLKERAAVNANPNDGEAWGRLGKLYKEMFFFRKGFRHDAGGRELYAMSVEAYEKSLALLPDDALWHAGFAELLAFHSAFASMEGQDTRAETVRAMQEIRRALEISPNDPKVNENAETIYFSFMDGIQRTNGGYDFLWLTATPELTPTFISPVEPTYTSSPPATDTPLPTATVVHAREATPTPAPVTVKNPLCGSAALVLFAVLGFLYRRASL